MRNKRIKNLTQREYFAIMALQGLIAGNSMWEEEKIRTPSNGARLAVNYADALIRKLNDATTE